LFIDIIGEGTGAQTLLENVICIQFETLEKESNKDSKLKNASDMMKKLLIVLVEYTYKASEKFTIPTKAFEIITQLWKLGASTEEFNLEVLSLLELSMAKERASEKDDAENKAISVLLEACCEPIVKHILAGNPCVIDIDSLRASCIASLVDVSSIVIDRLDDSLLLTPNLIDVIHIGYSLLADKVDEQHEYIERVMEYLLKQLTAVADANIMSDKDTPEDEFYDKLVEFVTVLTSNEFSWATELNTEIVRDFILTSLMDNIANAAAIRFIGILVDCAYANYDKLEPIETYLRRILDHKEYQSLTAPEVAKLLARQVPANSAQRLAIIQLISNLNKIQPSILANHHGLLDPLLTSYSATTSVTDKLILNILMSCERHGHETILPKMLMWGPGSDRTRQAHAQAGTLLQTGAISIETLSLIDPALMKYTFTHFPSDSVFQQQQQQQQSLVEEQQQPVYDPSFFYPLFANMISSGAIECRKFIECNGLGFVVMGMSSTNEDVRRVSYQMMDQFYVMVAAENSRFKDQPTIMFVLDAFKNSIQGRSGQDAPPRVPAAITVCVSHALSILLHPDHYMFVHISAWITRNSTFDFNVRY
jgi:hypothetical protein